MKTYYENPIMRITKFNKENVVTASGAGTGLQKKMESEGYTVTTVDLKAMMIF